jgi:hypothetical protein
MRKIQHGTQSPPPALRFFRLHASVNSRLRNIFNGLLLVQVNEEIPAFSFI